MIKKGLKVRVLIGKDKKKEGEVIEIDRQNNRAKVKGINIVKKHIKTMEEILYKKSKVAFQEFNKINKNKNKTFVVAGGVAANKKIREVLIKLCKEEN